MEKIKVGLIGFGLAGKVFHEPLIQTTGSMEITKVLSSRKDEVNSLLPEAEVVSSFDELIQDESIQLIVNCGPNSVHYSHTKAALEAGKHVVVEKPFVNNVTDGEELIQLAKDKNLLLTVYQNRRLDSDFLTVKDLIAENTFGEIKFFESHFDRFRPETQGEKWREKKGAGSGTLFDLGSHLIDQMLVLFGEPQSVLADVTIQKSGGETTDYFHLVFKYENGMRAVLHSGCFGDTSPRYKIEGSKANFVKYGLDVQEAQSRAGIRPSDAEFGIEDQTLSGSLFRWDDNTKMEKKVVSKKGRYSDFYNNLAQVIRGEETDLLVSPSEALRVIEIIEACYLSAKEGREIRLS